MAKKTGAQRRAEREAARPHPHLSPTSALPDEYPLMYSDLSPDERSGWEQEAQRAAKGLAGKSFTQRKVTSTVTGAEGADSMSVDAIAGRFRRHIEEAEQEAVAVTKATGKYHIPAGTRWYGDDNAEFGEITAETGQPKDYLIAAGAKVSPANDPKTQELPAVRGVARLVTENPEVRVSPESALHTFATQVRPKAAAQYRNNPVVVPPGTHRVNDLSPDQIAVLGSVSGHRVEARGDLAHPDLDAFRPLGAARNRGNISQSVQIIRDRARWSDLHNEGLDQPGKTTAYGLSKEYAGPEAHFNEQYNAMVHLHSHLRDKQFRLPFAHNESSAQDFWMKEASLGVRYDKPGAGKPAATAWDNSLRKGPVGAPDVSMDNVSVAMLNEAQSRSLADKPYAQSTGQSIVWNHLRPINKGQGAPAPDVPDQEVVDMFTRHEAQGGPLGRSSTFHASTNKPKADPNQGTLF